MGLQGDMLQAASGHAHGRGPLVSIIVPVYNMEGMLSKALDSALSQTLREVEVVCVDDGSTDGSLALMRAYAERDTRVVVLSQANAGPGAARNAGMRAARGEWLFFLDPDDAIASEGALEVLVGAARRSGASVVGGNISQHDDAGRPWGTDTRRLFPREGWLRFSQVEDCYGYWRYIFHRETLLEGGCFFPDYRRGQDPVFMTRVMDVVDDFYVVPDVVYAYTKGVGHVSWTPAKTRDAYGAFGEVCAYSRRCGYRHMHSAAANAVMSREQLLVTYGASREAGVPCTEALAKALSCIDPALLLSADGYRSFLRERDRFQRLLDEGSQESLAELDRLLGRMARKVTARSAMVAAVRRLAPALAWRLQTRMGTPLGSYPVAPTSQRPTTAETARGGRSLSL